MVVCMYAMQPFGKLRIQNTLIIYLKYPKENGQQRLRLNRNPVYTIKTN